MANNKGFIQSPITNINQIKQLLQDRYRKGFPILKELIQNADDAAANQLDFGWTPGIPDADHPLLRGPGLFFLNDGLFQPKDAKAIRHISLSSKVDEQSIGKFGLGLKSIFHLSEAYFYLASEDPEAPDASQVGYFGDILNPWSGDDELLLHSEWDEFGEASLEAITHFLSPLLDTPNWFCLWLPLRKGEHCQALDAIVQEFPGDESGLPRSIFLPDIEDQIARLFPLLRNIQIIRAWVCEGAQMPSAPYFTIQTGGASKRVLFAVDERPANRSLGGQVEVKSAQTSSVKMYFMGRESFFVNRHLEDLKRSEYWPKSTAVDVQTKGLKTVPEKAEAHGAVCFSMWPARGEGLLKVQHAVFLPLEEDYSLSCPGSHDFTLLLHGLFFVDPGRRNIHANTSKTDATIDSEQAIREAWNRILYRDEVLRLVLPALADFVQANALSTTSVESLTAALQQSELVRGHKRSISKHHHWCFCIQGQESTSWQLLPAEQPIYVLPNPPKSALNRPLEVFPQLQALRSDVAVTLADKPRLANTAEWSEELFLQVIDIVVEDVFGDQGKLEYYVHFLAGRNALLQQAACDQFLHTARQAIGCVPLSQLRGYQSIVRRFIALIPPSRRLALRGGHTETWDHVVTELAQADHSVLVIPEVLDPEETRSQGQLQPIEAYELLCMLAQPPTEWTEQSDFEEVRTRITLQLIATCADKDELLVLCGDLALFRGLDLCQDREIAFTSSELQLLYERSVLFAYGQPLNSRLARSLQRALPDVRIVLIHGETAQVLFGQDAVNVCSVSSCVDALGERPQLAGPEERGALLSMLLASSRDRPPDAYWQALRYLLHADPEHFENAHPLFVRRSHVAQALWEKMTREVLRLKGELWRVIPSELVEIIAGQYWNHINLCEIDPAGVVDLFSEIDVRKLEVDALSPTERELLLKDIDDLDVLKALRIHETTDGSLISIDGTKPAYLSGNFASDPVLQGRIHIVCPSKRPELAAKQKRMLKVLDAVAVLDILFGDSALERETALILDALAEVDLRQIPDALRQRIETHSWLPTQSGEYARPEDVICLSAIQSQLAQVMVHSSGVFVEASALVGTVRQHRAFSQVLERSLFPRRGEAVDMIGQAIEDRAAFHVGKFDWNGIADDELLDMLQEVFVGAPDDVMGIHGLISGVSKISPSICRDRLLPYLRRSLSADRLVRVLNYLIEQHTNASAAEKRRYIQVFNWYLQEAANSNGFATGILPRIQLINRRGNWVPSDQLCMDAHGVVEDVLIRADQGKILIDRQNEQQGEGNRLRSGIIPASVSAQVAEHADVHASQSGEQLKAYFEPWHGKVSYELLGCFLSVMGDDSGIKGLAKEYFDWGHRTVEATRDLMEWERAPNSGSFNESMQDTMRKQRFVLTVNQSDQVRVYNLLGEAISVLLHQDINNIFVGEDSCRLGQGDLRTGYINIRVIDVEQYTSTQLSEWLRNSTETLLRRIYGRVVPNLEEIWSTIDEREQLDIQIAQQLVLESAFFYLRQLGVNNHEKLQEVLRDFDRARRLKIEEQNVVEGGHRPTRQTADKDIRLAKEAFATIVRENEEVRGHILNAVKERIGGQYQYRPQSIPFELFQNADDAVVELHEMMDDVEQIGVTAIADQFIIVGQKNQISFMHWGRSINQFRWGTFNGQDKGYDRDLEKMLIMSSSDKDEGTTTPLVTGKFGLGFKSVFLICDKPHVLSDRLGFEVVGGMLPMPIDSQLHSRLRNELSQYYSRPYGGTIIELPFAEDGFDSDTVLSGFVPLAHVLLVFAKRIKQCQIHMPGEGRHTIAWHETPMPNTQNIYVGVFQPVYETEAGLYRGMVIRAGSGSVLLGVGLHGAVDLPDVVPTVWVTAPTQEKVGLGFAFDGAFNLDVGRAQLARSDDSNQRRAESLGGQVGVALVELFDAGMAEWDTLRQHLGFGPNVSPYEFWSSLWSVSIATVRSFRSESEREAVALAYTILWSSADRGMLYLVSNRSALPTGLWGMYRVLTCLEHVKYEVAGSLDSDSVFIRISQWPVFQDWIESGEVISRSQIGAYIDSTVGPQRLRLTLEQVLTRLVGDENCISPEMAVQLSQLISQEFIDALNTGSSAEQREGKTLIEWLHGLSFEGRDHRFHPSRELLIAKECAESDNDEMLRADFAPDDRVLSEEYTEECVELFRICRAGFSAPVKDMVDWALDAQADDQQLAVINYLLHGELNYEFAEKLRGEGRYSWLAEIRACSSFQMLNREEQEQVLWLLKIYIPTDDSEDESEDASHRFNPELVLARIAEWWNTHEEGLVARYERAVYPLGQPPSISADFFPSDIDDRENWLTLLLLGAMQTIGRTRPEQHRSFIELFKREGGLRVFCDPAQSWERWMGVLDNYLDTESEDHRFYQWMSRFPSIVQLAKWLHEYPECFLNIDRIDCDFQLAQITRPRNSPLFQGGGPDAPSLTRTLGIGANFVVRELMRLKVIENHRAYPYCYMPTQGVRQLLERLGCDGLDDFSASRWERSKVIHAFLVEHMGAEEATFGQCFDIPLWLVARDKVLQLRFFNEDLYTEALPTDDEVEVW